ncbi:ComF family protein [Rhizobium sp. BK377]|uniref:ComF family protein n=1 Tax=Rhizobium sp. BK377 TaxID=2587058 RepID=UPI0016210A01|nr:ComF family protein [Rhizobium sp. BK377]MBB3460664.1 putative amidophosphoribosyltransferase [Rhizobium sp. BK377]
MKVNLKKLVGPWDGGYALDKHMLSSAFLGNDEFGHARFDNIRTDAGEAVYQLKYKSDFNQSAILAAAVHEHIIPQFPKIGLIVPAPASTTRAKQPVDAVAAELAKLIGVKVFANIIVKAPSTTGKKLKDLATKQEKEAELEGRFSINDEITNAGQWNALVLDDLFHSGATMEAATKALRTYKKISGVYVAALTWK